MGFCDQCGAPRGERQRFCPRCGTALDAGTVIPGAPVGTPPLHGGPGGGAPPNVPGWLVSDWPVVGICVLVIAVVTAAVSATYGAVLGLAASGADGAGSGAITGAFLAFSAFGAASGAFRATEDVLIGFGTSFLPLPWVLVPVGAAWAAYRFGYPRVAPTRPFRVSFVGKVAVLFGLLAGILANVLSFDEGGEEDASGNLFSEVSSGSVAFYAVVVLALTGVVFLLRRGDLAVARDRLRGYATRSSLLLEGGKAFLGLAAAMAVVALVAGLLAADTMSERLLLLLAVPFLVVNLGIAGAVLAMGGSVGLGDTAEGDLGTSIAGNVYDHVSLFHWGFPPGNDAGTATPLLLVLLASAPLAVGWIAYRQLERRGARSEQDVWAVGFLVGLGFALVAFLAAFFGRILAGAFASDLERSGDLFIRPSIAAALGLGLLWGVVGGLGAGYVWARRHDMAVRLTSGAPAGGAGGLPATAGASCPRCGAAVAAPAAFCSACGERIA